MMKRQRAILLVILLVTSLSVNNMQAKNEGLIAGACALGAAFFGMAGAIAFVDWFCSETDEQFIARVNSDYSKAYSYYNDTMVYFGKISGMNHYVSASYKPFNNISESVLYEFATYVWHQKSTQAQYRSNLIDAKNIFQLYVSSLRKRIHDLEEKPYTQAHQYNLRALRKLLYDVEDFLPGLILLADCLEHHSSYFNLYDSIDTIRTRYIQEITIFESGRYSTAAEIKLYILNNSHNERFVLKNFVHQVDQDVAIIIAGMHALVYNYEARKQYAQGLINILCAIKNIVVIDPYYQEELYQWEQDHLQQLHRQAVEVQMSAEHERAKALSRQQKIAHEWDKIQEEKAMHRCYHNGLLW